ncbi:MAG TPA: response regulator transcription factor [Blastocatellia bacterium]|nr:response regulator transcription factor [Blastocatellia bacterium]
MSADRRIIIMDDHPIFRSGLRQTIEAAPRLRVIGEAADGQTGLSLIETLKPEVTILDINMPVMDGLDVLREVRRRRLPGEFIVLTMHSEEAMFNQAVSLGVKGYVLKDSATTDIVNCIHAVLDGQTYTSPAITSYLFKRAYGRGGAGDKLPGLGDLTPTERTILRLIAEYKTSKEIAEQLCIHYRTVENYRSNICTKLNLRGSHALIKFALQHQTEL